MTAVLTGLAVYVALSLLGLLKVLMERPGTCPKGHTDLYCCDVWRCRICAALTEQRGLRKRARERTRGLP